MSNLVRKIEKYVKDKSEEYRMNSSDNYDFWNEHIKYVYYEAERLANKFSADVEIVKIGALLHDIALIECVGDRKDHHINGKILSNDILDKYGCPSDMKDRILGCVLNHRSSKNATNNEELCVCDADILAHFDNIPMVFYSAFNRYGVKLSEINDWLTCNFEKDYNDLSDRTKEEFKSKYELLKKILIIDLNI